ncbi:MAG: response regulator transcription factor [Cyanobacteria bacterium CRU_2_1]|nr:response regulator transcription factor [Cyanobacteria bacterium RU_5_0]NJR58767.1 response regulator transcription factor [Cyanobacteria bacterium CRU_2_1]
MPAQLLLVDDEPGLCEAVKAYLQEDGYQVQVASSANEGWELVCHNTPDLVITDIMMPQIDGYQFLRQLRDDPRFKMLPVVFLTAKGMRGDRIQGYQAGCDAYLSKPFSPEELVAIVENLLKRRGGLVQSSGSGENGVTLTALDERIRRLEKLLEGFLAGGRVIVAAPAPIKLTLTPREKDVLNLVAAGLMNKEIASRLKTSVRNVEKYVSRLFDRTGTSSRTELVRFALEHGLTK